MIKFYQLILNKLMSLLFFCVIYNYNMIMFFLSYKQSYRYVVDSSSLLKAVMRPVEVQILLSLVDDCVMDNPATYPIFIFFKSFRPYTRQ